MNNIVESKRNSFNWTIVFLVLVSLFFSTSCSNTEEDLSKAKEAYKIGYSQFAKADYINAINNFSKAINLCDLTDAYHKRGLAYIKLKDFDKALDDFKYIKKHEDKYDDAEYYIGYCLYKKNKFTEAAECFTNSIKRNKIVEMSYLYRGICRFAVGKTKEAIEDENRVLSINPNNYKAAKFRGDCYFHLRDFDKAIENYKQALVYNQEYETAKINKDNAEKAIIALKYDLEILKIMTHDELQVIVDLILDKWSERLSKYPNFKEDYTKYSAEIGNELLLFGGNSFVNAVRGHGVTYEELLTDVCKQMDVDYGFFDKVKDKETLLCAKINDDAMKQMEESEKQRLKEIEESGLSNFIISWYTDKLIFTIAEPVLLPYLESVAIAGAVATTATGITLTITAGTIVKKALGLLSKPFTWAVTGMFTAYNVSGPAYKVTVPAVIYIAAIRQRYINGPVAIQVDEF